jgi:hypothetical protein
VPKPGPPLTYRRGVHDIAGLVALAIVGLWIAYLVPHRLRYRQQLLESRTEDRFSDALRVLVVTDPRGPGRRVAEARAECGPDSPKRSGLLSPARGVPMTGRQAVTERKGGVVERPYGTQDKMTADAARRQAQLRARRAAAVSRRAAAAKRRSVLTVALLVVSAAAWAVVGLTSLTVAAAVVPSVLLLGVLGLGRRAVVRARAANAAWEQQQRRLQSQLARPATGSSRITGRALHPSDSHTEAVPHVAPRRADDAATAGSLPAQATATGSTAVDTATIGPVASDDAGRATTSSDDADPAPSPSADTTDAERDGAFSADASPCRCRAPPTPPRPPHRAASPSRWWSRSPPRRRRPPSRRARRTRRPLSARPPRSTSTRSWPAVAPWASDLGRDFADGAAGR